jgi:hypothetical protein
MKLFKKISAIATSALMIGMTMGIAAAANYPSPFVAGGSADVAIVYGTGSGVSSLDMVQAANLQSDLSGRLGTGAGGTSGSVTGGDSFLIAKSSDRLNIANTWGVFSGTVTKDDLKTLLKDGTYVAGDNDEFDYEQKITLGAPTLAHFRDSDYEALIGLTAKTPTVGFRLTSNTAVLNYTLDFTSDVTSDVTTGLRMEDIEGSDLPLMGRTYYVSELDNGTSTAYFGKLILLDAANTGNVKEGETVTVSGHEVSIDWIDSTNVVFMIDGVRAPASGKLVVGNSYKLVDGSYIGVRDISSKAVSGTVGSASFSIGTGKLELNHGSDIKMNDDSVTNMKSWIYKSTGDKLDKIVIEWKTDEESYLTPEKELLMPGFDALKFTMNKLIRNTEEKITLEKDGDTAMELTLPIKRGEVSLDVLYIDTLGNFSGIGKSATERLLSSNFTNITFFERRGGNDYHKYFVATYNISKEGESYLLRAQVSPDTTAGRNETTIQSYENGAWTDVCKEKTRGDTCNIGDVSLTIGVLNYTSGGDESVVIASGTNVNFHTVITPGGLVVYLPYANTTYDAGAYFDGSLNASSATGALNLGQEISEVGHDWRSVYLTMDSEDKDETLSSGIGFSFTINDNTDLNVQVQHVNTSGGNYAGTGSGGVNGLEVGDTGAYETYVRDDVAPRILHYTKPDEDWAEIYYPTGDSETYAEVFLTEAGAVLVPGATGSSGNLGEILVKDTEVSSVSSKNLVVVGGSCINSVAANLVGGAYCGSAWTEKTGVGTGEFLIKSYAGKYTAGKIALLVAGYEAADTVAATTALKTKVVDTAKEYKGTTSTTTVTEVTAA